MNTTSQRSGSSIALRLIIAIVLAIVLPIVIVFALIELEIQNLDEESLSRYVEDQGEERLGLLNRIFDTVFSETDRYVEVANLRTLLGLAASQNLTDSVLTLIRNDTRVFVEESDLFETFDLIDLEGNILLHFGTNREETDPVTTYVGTAAFDELVNMSELLTVYRLGLLGEETNELVLRYVIYERALATTSTNSEIPVGYIIATINRDYIVDALIDQGEYVTLSHYLMTTNGDGVFTNAEYEQSAQRSAAVTTDLLTSNNGFIEYDVQNTGYIAHYAQLDNIPLFLVSEIPASTTLSLSLRGIYTRGLLVVIFVGAFGILAAVYLSQSITRPLAGLKRAMISINEGDFDHAVVENQRSDEIGDLARTFTSTRSSVRASIENLENQLARHTRDMQLTREISSFATTQRNLQVLMDRVVDLIIELFPNIYHAQIFLVDDEREQAVLRASTGDAGRNLLARGHRLSVGSVSVIGQATGDQRVVIARDTAESAIHRRNEFLPDTRAELAIPLTVGNQIIGALDLQSRQSDSFGPDEVTILQTLADQIAVAIENARLYQESLRRLVEVGDINRQQVEGVWREYLNYRRETQLNRSAGITNPIDLSPLRETALTSGQVAIGTVTEHNTIPIAVPIQLRGQVLGAVEWELPQSEFSDAKVQLAQELVSRLAVTLDNARLFQESQRAVQREQMVNRIAAQLTGQTDIDDILQTAVREVGQALRVPQVDIHFNWTKNGNNNSHDEQGE